MIFYTANCMIVSPIFLSTAMPGSLYVCTTSESSKTSQPLGISESIGCGGHSRLFFTQRAEQPRIWEAAGACTLYVSLYRKAYRVSMQLLQSRPVVSARRTEGRAEQGSAERAVIQID